MPIGARLLFLVLFLVYVAIPVLVNTHMWLMDSEWWRFALVNIGCALFYVFAACSLYKCVRGNEN